MPEVRSFLGMSGYYRQCLPNYAHIAEPLVKLTRKYAQFQWGVEQQKANEPLTITSSWDPHWTVTQICGKVLYVRHEPSGKTKILNRDKVQIVDPDVIWDDVNPRPVRQSNKSTRLTGVRA